MMTPVRNLRCTITAANDAGSIGLAAHGETTTLPAWSETVYEDARARVGDEAFVDIEACDFVPEGLVVKAVRSAR
jgi:hypothetical protein